MNKETYDVIIIGAGIIGLATALKLLEKKPNIKLGIMKKIPKSVNSKVVITQELYTLVANINLDLSKQIFV